MPPARWSASSAPASPPRVWPPSRTPFTFAPGAGGREPIGPETAASSRYARASWRNSSPFTTLPARWRRSICLISWSVALTSRRRRFSKASAGAAFASSDRISPDRRRRASRARERTVLAGNSNGARGSPSCSSFPADARSTTAGADMPRSTNAATTAARCSSEYLLLKDPVIACEGFTRPRTTGAPATSARRRAPAPRPSPSRPHGYAQEAQPKPGLLARRQSDASVVAGCS